MPVIRVGTRRSMLALRQTDIVMTALRKAHPGIELKVVEIVTTGDRKQGTPAAAHGDKKDWVLEFEQGLIQGEIDLAVHSGKDVPVDIAPGTAARSVMKRSTPFDVLILSEELSAKGIHSLTDLPDGARIGTASLRRGAGIINACTRAGRQGISVVPLRGNVTTRVEKLRAGNDYDAIVIAGASLERLTEIEVKSVVITADLCLPAMNQGILAVQLREDDTKMHQLLSAIEDRATADAFTAEREAIRILNADCKSAVGLFATYGSAGTREELQVSGRVYARDGSRVIEHAVTGPAGNDESSLKLGRLVGDALLSRGAADLL